MCKPIVVSYRFDTIPMTIRRIESLQGLPQPHIRSIALCISCDYETASRPARWIKTPRLFVRYIGDEADSFTDRAVLERLALEHDTSEHGGKGRMGIVRTYVANPEANGNGLFTDKLVEIIIDNFAGNG